MSGLIVFILYFAPSFINWYRARQGKQIVFTVKQMFVINLLTAWTGVMWLLLLVNAFGFNPVASLAVRMAKGMPSGPTGPALQDAPSSPQASACGQCGGSGSMPCSTCGGRGSWYDAPTGESGVAQLQNCGACTSSGRIRCPYCGGSGRLA